MPKRPYPKHRFRHDTILLYFMEHPAARQRDIAAATGYTPSQVSRILNSPDFQQRYEYLLRGAMADAKQIALSRPWPPALVGASGTFRVVRCASSSLPAFDLHNQAQEVPAVRPA